MKASTGVARTSTFALCLLVTGSLLAGCGRSASDNETTNLSPTKDLVTTTPAGTGEADSVTWGLYRDVQSLDPIYAFDYPENTAVSLMCESVLKQDPSGQIVDGLATLTSQTDDKIVLTVNDKATFWDGKPVTAADIVFSLQRNTDPALGGFYGLAFSRVASIKAQGDTVVISLKQPDYWLPGELASMPGVVVEKSFAEQKGATFATPSGGTMCSGAYKVKSWDAGSGLTAAANQNYWGGAAPKTAEIVLKGVTDNAAMTSGLTTGAIDGAYAVGIPTLPQLMKSSAVKVYQGPSTATDLFVVSDLDGTLGDVKVRQALSLALDRTSIIDNVYHGAAMTPRWISNPGSFGYGQDTFDAAYNKAPEMTQDLDKAKTLVQEAGAQGKTFVLALSTSVGNFAQVAAAYQQAANAIGLKMTLKNLSANDFISLFTDPSAREGVDAFLTVNYGDFADPAALLSTIVLPGASQNFSGFSDDKITSLLDQARSTADDDQRAALVSQAEDLAAEQLPWIPTVQPTNLLLMNSSLSGAVASFSYMFAPWANDLGSVG